MPRKKRGEDINGWVNFDKPLGMGSTQAVAFVRRVFNANKAGHAGTLDPLASGVLPIALGEATKTVPYSMDASKQYQFTATFGVQTNTDDAEGEAIFTSDKRPSRAQVEAQLANFIGEIQQTPPIFSAIKINGQTAYAKARKGEEVEMKSRLVTIHDIKLLDFTGETATFSVHCGKGTYIRSIARDMGQNLGCYGFVSELIRTRVGNFLKNEAVSKEKLDSCLELGQSAQEFLQGVEVVLDDIPAYRASLAEVNALQRGEKLQRVTLSEGMRKVIGPRGNLVSLVMVDEDGVMRVERNFVSSS